MEWLQGETNPKLAPFFGVPILSDVPSRADDRQLFAQQPKIQLVGFRPHCPRASHKGSNPVGRVLQPNRFSASQLYSRRGKAAVPTAGFSCPIAMFLTWGPSPFAEFRGLPSLRLVCGGREGGTVQFGATCPFSPLFWLGGFPYEDRLQEKKLVPSFQPLYWTQGSVI